MILAQTEQPFVRWDWIADHTDIIWERLIQHMQLTAISVALGLVIAFPLAVYAFRHRRAYAPITAVTGILYTIPSLAFFAFLLPYTGLRTPTAVIPLVCYTLLILIRNTVAGLSGVPDDVVEAAKGMGYSGRQLLWKVQLPLALPVIIAGVRIATVTTIGLVTVTALIGQGGLGYFILIGIRQFFSTPSILGAVLSVILAVTVDALLLMVQKLLSPWQRTARTGAS